MAALPSDFYDDIVNNYTFNAAGNKTPSLPDLYGSIVDNYYKPDIINNTQQANLSASPLLNGLTQKVAPDQIYKELEAGYGLNGITAKELPEFKVDNSVLYEDVPLPFGLEGTQRNYKVETINDPDRGVLFRSGEDFLTEDQYLKNIEQQQRSQYDQQHFDDYNLNLITSAMQGKDVSLQDVLKGSHRANEIIPNNPAQSQIAEQFDSLYTTKANRQLQLQMGQALGLTPEEVNKVSGYLAADMYQSGRETGYEPFDVGANNLSQRYTDALLNYADRKYDTKIDRAKFNEVSSGLDKKFQDARAIESHSGGFFSEMMPVLSLASMFIPGAQAFMPYVNAAMAAANGNIGGAALSLLGAQGMPLADLGGKISGALNIAPELGNVLASMGKSGLGQLFSTGEIAPEKLLMAGATSGLNQLFKGK